MFNHNQTIPIIVAAKHHTYDVFTNIMYITFYSCQNNSSCIINLKQTQIVYTNIKLM